MPTYTWGPEGLLQRVSLSLGGRAVAVGGMVPDPICLPPPHQTHLHHPALRCTRNHLISRRTRENPKRIYIGEHTIYCILGICRMGRMP